MLHPGPLLLGCSLAFALFVTACQPGPGAAVDAGPTVPPAAAAPAPSPALAVLAAEYRALRAVQGHFGSPAGAWNEAVDAPGGRNYVAMDELRKQLGDGKHGKAEIVALLGPPDEIAPPGSQTFTLFMHEAHPPRIDEVLAYHWRNRHDVLGFMCDGPSVTSAAWWMAGE